MLLFLNKLMMCKYIYQITEGDERMNDTNEVIFADVQKDKPRNLCLRENGELYICNVVETKHGYQESNIVEVSEVEALIFIANVGTKT